jgi:hypothetical protein
MSAETLLDEFIEFRNEHNDHWPEGLISVEIDDWNIKLQFELNIQSQSFFNHEFEGLTLTNHGEFTAQQGNIKVTLIKQQQQ